MLNSIIGSIEHETNCSRIIFQRRINAQEMDTIAESIATGMDELFKNIHSVKPTLGEAAVIDEDGKPNSLRVDADIMGERFAFGVSNDHLFVHRTHLPLPEEKDDPVSAQVWNIIRNSPLAK